MSTKSVAHQINPTSAKPAPAVATPVTAPTPTPAPTPQTDQMKKARSARTKRPENETQEQTFKRLVEPRVTKLLKVIRQVRLLARFKPTEAQRKKVFDAIDESLTAAQTAWKGNVEVEKEKFQL